VDTSNLIDRKIVSVSLPAYYVSLSLLLAKVEISEKLYTVLFIVKTLARFKKNANSKSAINNFFLLMVF